MRFILRAANVPDPSQRRRIAAASCPVALAAANSNRRFKSGFILSRRNSALLSACPASTAQPCRSQQSEYLAKPFLSSFVSWQIRMRGCFRQETAPGRQKNFWEVRRAVALRTVFRIQRHVRWIRKPCAARFPCAFPRPRRRRRREASALWALARSAKRPAGVSKYKGCARPARRTPIFASRGNVFWRIKPPQADFFDTLSLRLKTQTPCPPSKAGKYELTLEGLRALQTSRKGF